MEKTLNNKAWFMVLPVLIIVALNAIVPLMTVVNYSVQDTFGNNVFFFEGTRWYSEVLASGRFHAALQRQFLFTATILAIEIPLGVAIALPMPRGGFRSEEHTSELTPLMRISYAVFCLKKKNRTERIPHVTIPATLKKR